ncbi:hypothetical protein NNC19_18005 [Clostridium sp. SHJSY1]|uniref:hypothetical protein n=1 Tax=Clostridium sp. SHJSY1 TaxID=2942483 RepID=UPI0028746AB7|nr:hypothetical protein [Clostridium sp. SHJSY1]MDS0527588.1 hypothetical protein [Clostridium sp. SHJSY1]
MSTKDYKLKNLRKEINVLKELLLEDLNNNIPYHKSIDNLSKLLECKYLLENHHNYLKTEFFARNIQSLSNFQKKFFEQNLIEATALKNKLNSFLISYLHL